MARRGAAFVAMFALGGLAIVGWAHVARSSQAPISVPVSGVGVSARVLDRFRLDINEVVPRVDEILDVSPRPFKVSVYGSERKYAQVLRASQGETPAGSWDASGNIVRGFLPVEADLGEVKHHIAHVYSEWVFDGETHNSSDEEPDPAWLYDGLAEVIAERVAPTGSCRLRGFHPLSLTALSSPTNWWRVRTVGGGGMEYCEARLAARHIVDRLGWRTLDWKLHVAASWPQFSRSLGARG